jgi:hypothetical protein
MTQNEYLVVSNLQQLRTALSLVTQCMGRTTTKNEEAKFRDIAKRIDNLAEQLEKQVARMVTDED